MEITDRYLLVTVQEPITNAVIADYYFGNITDAMDCFNAALETYPLAVVELGVYTFCKNPKYDSYRVVKSNC